MSKRKRQAVQRYHDRVAHRYDDIYDDLYWRWHDKLTWEYLKPYLPRSPNAAIVDLGCGTGKWGIKIARSGFAVTCVDISTKMVETARRKVGELDLQREVSCLQADLADLSKLPAEHFALATAFGEPLCSVDSPAGALKQIRRILEPGGLLVGTIDNRLNGFELYLEKGDTAGLVEYAKTGRTHWLTKDHHERFELNTFTPGQWRRLLEKAKFEVVEIVGKTVLPMRRYRSLLEDKDAYTRLLKLERKLARDADGLGRAAHLQFVARKT